MYFCTVTAAVVSSDARSSRSPFNLARNTARSACNSFPFTFLARLKLAASVLVMFVMLFAPAAGSADCGNLALNFPPPWFCISWLL